ncbi:MAG: hypothetical protein Q9167_005502 [Letrouitia subvulpina]
MLPSLSPNPQNPKRQRTSGPAPVSKPLPAPPSKRRKVYHYPTTPPPEFYDRLSRQWLTLLTLQEWNRRTSTQDVTWPINHHQIPSLPSSVERFARQGGPDLTDLRGCRNQLSQPAQGVRSMSTSQNSRKRPRSGLDEPSQSSPSKKKSSKNTGPYDLQFEQHLIDHYIWPDGYRDDGEEPSNIDEIQSALEARRRSVSPSQFPAKAFEDFKRAVHKSKSEDKVMSDVIPDIVGTSTIPNNRNILFTNLAPLTDGTIVAAKPDLYDGILPADLKSQVRNALGLYITPSKNTSLPCLPNLFLEAKADANANVGKRQVCYDGAIGARGTLILRSAIEPDTAIDGNAYTLSSVYHNSTCSLKIYAHHPFKSSDPKWPVGYRMTLVGSWALDFRNSFRPGIQAYRNARDWAKKQRTDLALAVANVPAKTLTPSLASSTQILGPK